MRNFPIGAILAVIALILALLAMLDLVKGDIALGLAIICLALAMLLPLAAGISTDRDRA